jgi:hypothetical protein
MAGAFGGDDIVVRARGELIDPSGPRKCGVSTRAGLAMFAMRHGLAARTG